MNVSEIIGRTRCPICGGDADDCGMVETSTGLPDLACEYGCDRFPDITWVF